MSVKTKENKYIELLEDENERIRLIAEYEVLLHTPPQYGQKNFFLKNAFLGVFGVGKHESAISFLI